MKLNCNRSLTLSHDFHRFRKKYVLALRRLEISIDEFKINDPKLNN